VRGPPSPRHCERSEAIHLSACGAMDCFVAVAPRNDELKLQIQSSLNEKGIRARLLAAWFARGLHERRPLEKRGSRECRVRAAPAVSCAKLCEECAHEHTGSAETLRHSPRNGLTAYAALSPATNSSCHRRCRLDGCSTRLDRINHRQLDTSNGCQDHTVLPYALAPFVLRAG
jgi:hypothetical protein